MSATETTATATAPVRYILVCTGSRDLGAAALGIDRQDGSGYVADLEALLAHPGAYLDGQDPIIWSTTDLRKAQTALSRARAGAHRWRTPAHRIGIYHVQG